MKRTASLFGLAALAVSAPAFAAAPVIDNERVTVWDVTLAKGETGPATSRDLDTVVMFLEGGRIRTAPAHGKATLATHKFGDAVFVPRGTEARDTVVAGGPAHEIVVALKDHRQPPIVNPTKYPAAFPRPGSVKVLDNSRVVVWHFSWKPGVPTPMHFHDKEVVVAYRYDGALKSVAPDGKETINAYKTGDIRFNKANRTHYELLVGPRQSAVMMELK